MEISQPTSRDAEAISQVVTSAFNDGGRVAELVLQLRPLWLQGKGFELVAKADGGQIVAHIGFTCGYLDDPTRLEQVLVLSPLSVAAAHQGQGFGLAMVKEGLRVAETFGVELVFLEGIPAFYPRLGFVPAGPEGFIKPSVRIPDEAFMAKYLATPSRQLSGALIYPEVFWATDSVGLRE